MTSCTFLGHRDCPPDTQKRPREMLVNLIENHGVEFFYISHQGQFDSMARNALRELENRCKR